MYADDRTTMNVLCLVQVSGWCSSRDLSTIAMSKGGHSRSLNISCNVHCKVTKEAGADPIWVQSIIATQYGVFRYCGHVVHGCSKQ